VAAAAVCFKVTLGLGRYAYGHLREVVLGHDRDPAIAEGVREDTGGRGRLGSRRGEADGHLGVQSVALDGYVEWVGGRAGLGPTVRERDGYRITGACQAGVNHMPNARCGGRIRHGPVAGQYHAKPIPARSMAMTTAASETCSTGSATREPC
jgi:ribosomal protein L4